MAQICGSKIDSDRINVAIINLKYMAESTRYPMKTGTHLRMFTAFTALNVFNIIYVRFAKKITNKNNVTNNYTSNTATPQQKILAYLGSRS